MSKKETESLRVVRASSSTHKRNESDSDAQLYGSKENKGDDKFSKLPLTVHKPVLLNEVLESLRLEEKDMVFDGTLGGGGYAQEICKIISGGILIGTDLDEEAIKRTRKRLESFLCRKEFFQKNYSEIKNILEKLNIEKIDKIVLDLGISSDQLEIEKKGISFQNLDDDLDMNLASAKEDKALTAGEILNSWSEESMADIFFYYGGEKASRKVAKAIVERRGEKDFEKVSDLVELIEEEIGYFYKNKKIHPATKIFQALRITVNDEIENLKKTIKEGVDVLKEGGIFSIVTFHSLEDKVVKNIFRELEDSEVGERVNKKVIKPSEEEVNENKRSRSAKLRVFRKK
jgi:16S rRNA (cytosine1402-N4)-methyltransferase